MLRELVILAPVAALARFIPPRRGQGSTQVRQRPADPAAAA
jgi:hypothetical protein